MKRLPQIAFLATAFVTFSCSSEFDEIFTFDSDSEEEYVDVPRDEKKDPKDGNPNDDGTPDESSDVEIGEEDLAILNTQLNLPQELFNYDVDLPDFFFDRDLQSIDNMPADNPVTNIGATLGRVLFYDQRLSANNTISCASCHIQENGFSDPNTFSIGFEGGLTGRNSMGLANARFYENGSFFWDERAETLEDQVLMPIQDAVEMGLTLEELEQKLSQEDYYSVLFRLTFGDDTITSDRIALALAQFIRAMVSFESRYDVGLAQVGDNDDDFPNFTDSENRGKQLFFSNATRCSDCHHTNAFTGDAARNNGLDGIFIDLGVGGVTGNNDQIGEFKVPSLRNIAQTAPYMHDGRFATLADVIEHYNSGVQNSTTLDNRLQLQRNGIRRLDLSDADKQALIDFMETLTDDQFLTDEKFSDPFIN